MEDQFDTVPKGWEAAKAGLVVGCLLLAWDGAWEGRVESPLVNLGI